jgi:cardiolipin synthase
MYIISIVSAVKSIYITNAYFLPDPDTLRALEGAVRRGVDVRVIVPGEKTDVPIVRQASRLQYEMLLRRGIRIFEYQPTMMHAKTMVVDGIWTTIGSINFVNRSMKKNAEANVAIYDHGFAEIVEKSIQGDLEKSREFTKRMWKRRGLLTRVAEAFSWLFSENY